MINTGNKTVKRLERCRRRGACLVTALAFALGADAGLAETIREVVVVPQGAVPVEETHVRAHIGSKAGDTLSPEAVARDVRALLETRRYAYVGTVLEPAGRSPPGCFRSRGGRASPRRRRSGHAR